MKLNLLSYKELQKLGENMYINKNSYNTKKELIEIIEQCFNMYEKYKEDNIDKYEIKEQLGNKGKEGITYLVVDKENGKEYAMKCFNSRKSIKNIEREGLLQKKASEKGISPKIININLVGNNIIMEKMDRHLYDVMNESNGNISEKYQEQILCIFNKLDECKVFHGDSNILNYMIKNDKVYIIDFGMSKEIDKNFKKKIKEDKPNYTLMNLGLIIKLKELKCPDTSYSYLIKYVSNENKIKYGL